MGSYDGKVYALDAATGDFIWSYLTAVFGMSSSAGADSAVYIGSYDHWLYAFGSASSGEENGTPSAPIPLLPVIAIAVAAVVAVSLVGILLCRRKLQRQTDF